jgi:hypothetical protein
VFLQVLLVGRTLDDISVAPISDEEWTASMRVLLSEMVRQP